LGRPRQIATPARQQLAELQEENERLRRELVASQVRTEIADCFSSRGGEYLKAFLGKKRQTFREGHTCVQ
jgi:hypothetical protein